MVTGLSSGDIQAWDINRMERVAAFEAANSAMLCHVMWCHPKICLTSSNYGLVTITDFREQKPVMIGSFQCVPCHCLSWDPVREILVAGLWTGELLLPRAMWGCGIMASYKGTWFPARLYSCTRKFEGKYRSSARLVSAHVTRCTAGACEVMDLRCFVRDDGSGFCAQVMFRDMIHCERVWDVATDHERIVSGGLDGAVIIRSLV